MKTLKAALLALLIGAIVPAIAWSQNVGNVPSGGNVVSSPNFTVRNSGTSATSNAYLEARVSGTSAGDPHLRLTIPSGTSWYMGADNSASDALKIGTGTAVGTAQLAAITTAGLFGVGPGTPAVQLDVNDTASNVVGRIYSNGGTRTATFQVTTNAVTTQLFAGDSAAAGRVGTTTAHPLELHTNNAAKMSIASDGRITFGMGAAAPGEGRYMRRAHVQTTNATVTTVATIAIGTSKVHALRVSLTALRSTSAEGAYYERLAGYKNNAGTVTLLGAAASPITAEDTAAWDITLTISTTNVLVQVTGEAAKTIEWECVIEEVVTAAS